MAMTVPVQRLVRRILDLDDKAELPQNIVKAYDAFRDMYGRISRSGMTPEGLCLLITMAQQNRDGCCVSEKATTGADLGTLASGTPVHVKVAGNEVPATVIAAQVGGSRVRVKFDKTGTEQEIDAGRISLLPVEQPEG